MEEKILEFLRKDPATPDEIATQLKISWATANGHLLKLVGEGKAVLVRKGRVNVYHAKNPSSVMFSVPKWVKSKSLKQLSDELVNYFPKNLTAAEMIMKERRTG